MMKTNEGERMKNGFMVRQGDVLLVKITELPLNIVKKDKVLAYGEVTGHKLRFSSEQVTVFKNGNDEQFVQVLESSPLLHEEHETVVVPKGVFKVVLQRELSLLNQTKQVVD